MNFKNKKEGLFILLLIFSCLPLVLPLLKPGFFPIHDDQHFVRLQQLDQALKDGHFPARWV